MICLQITDLEEQIQVMRNEIRKQNEIVGELEKSIFKKRFCTISVVLSVYDFAHVQYQGNKIWHCVTNIEDITPIHVFNFGFYKYDDLRIWIVYGVLL